MVFGEDLLMFNAGNFIAWMTAMALFIVLVEFALAHIFKSKLWLFLEEWIDIKLKEKLKLSRTDIFDLKPWICAGLCIWLVFAMDIDFFAFLFQKESLAISKVFTGLFVAGGSTRLVNALKRWGELKTAVHESAVTKAKNNT